MKKINFDLEIGKKRISNLDDLKSNFHLQNISDYFDSGILEIWLEKIEGGEEPLKQVKKLRKKLDNDIVLKHIKSSKKEKYEGLIEAFNIQEDNSRIIINSLVDFENIYKELKNEKEIEAKNIMKKYYRNYEDNWKKLLEIKSSNSDSSGSKYIKYYEYMKKTLISNPQLEILFLEKEKLNNINPYIDIIEDAYDFFNSMKLFEDDIIRKINEIQQPIITIKMLCKKNLRLSILKSKEAKTKIENYLSLFNENKDNQVKFTDYYSEIFNSKGNNNYLILKDKKEYPMIIVSKEEFENRFEKNPYILALSIDGD